MKTLNLLNGLQDYITLLSTVKEFEEENHPALKNAAHPLVKKASLSYDFISLELSVRKEKDAGKYSYELYLKCVFRIDSNKIELDELYCEKREREEEIKKFILHHAPSARFPQNVNFTHYSKETLGYISMADEISRETVNCTRGDNYRPGYFSKITVTEESIRLEQINHWNAKSTAHKENYSLRNLEFFIPLDSSEKKLSFDDYEIGKMHIRFSDGSSKNNRSCGDRIREKILEQKSIFEQKEL